jgi:hypothetical protein
MKFNFIFDCYCTQKNVSEQCFKSRNEIFVKSHLYHNSDSAALFISTQNPFGLAVLARLLNIEFYLNPPYWKSSIIDNQDE